MHETITLSLSHQANHVSTHLYNNQESHLSYKKGIRSDYDNDVYLTATKTFQGTTNYNPRAIVYELNGGIGALGKYDYYGPEIRGKIEEDKARQLQDGAAATAAFETIGADSTIFKPYEKIEKNSYQKALDAGSVKQGMLTTENTKYWSDYNKLIYKPSSLNSLTNWVHDASDPASAGFSRHGEERRFDNYWVGSGEYKSSATTTDEHIELFRAFLEDCDLFQGMNVLTEVDSGWGGFTSEFLTDIKDEYFNNGGDSKYSFWLWASYNDKLKLNYNTKLSRVKTTLELIKSSTLYFGLSGSVAAPSAASSSHSALISSEHYDPASSWHSSALKSLLVDNLWTISNQNEQRISMSQFESELLRGNTSRNIVAELHLHAKNEAKESSGANLGRGLGSMMIDVKREDMYDLYGMTSSSSTPAGAPEKRSEPAASDAISSISFSDNLYPQQQKKCNIFSKGYVTPSGLDLDLASLNKQQLETQGMLPITQFQTSNPSTMVKNYTFPQNILNPALRDEMFTEYAISSRPKELLKDYRVFLQRSSRITNTGEYLDNFDKDELIEETNNLIEDYVYEWEDDDEDWE